MGDIKHVGGMTMRLVKRDEQGFYMDGDGIWCEQDGASEKFRGEDIDWFGAVEEALGDARSPEQIRALVQGRQKGRWIENSGADGGFHFCSECRKQAFTYNEGNDVYEVLTEYCPHCGAEMDRAAVLLIKA